jgi:hypothetical protein
MPPYFVCWRIPWCKRSLKIPQSEAVNWRRTYNTMAKGKGTSNDLQNITQKTKDLETRTQLKTGSELMCSGRDGSSCSTSGTSRVNLVTKFMLHVRFLFVLSFPPSIKLIATDIVLIDWLQLTANFSIILAISWDWHTVLNLAVNSQILTIQGTAWCHIWVNFVNDGVVLGGRMFQGVILGVYVELIDRIRIFIPDL